MAERTTLTLTIPLTGIEQTRCALSMLATATEVTQRVLAKAPEYGDDAALQGAGEVLAAGARLIALAFHRSEVLH